MVNTSIDLHGRPIAVTRPALEGEILLPGESVQVTAAMHPFKMATQVVEMPVGSSIAEIVAACERHGDTSRLSVGARVEINGHVIPKELWHCVRVKAGATVLVQALAGKALGSIIKTVFSVGLLILGSVLTGGLGLPAFAAGAITAGVPCVGGLSRGLFKPRAALEV